MGHHPVEEFLHFQHGGEPGADSEHEYVMTSPPGTAGRIFSTVHTTRQTKFGQYFPNDSSVYIISSDSKKLNNSAKKRNQVCSLGFIIKPGCCLGICLLLVVAKLQSSSLDTSGRE